MRRLGLGFLTITLVLLAGCSRVPGPPDRAAQEAAATARLQEIPPASPEKYRKMSDMKNWRNPYLVVLPEGIGLLDPDNNEQRLLKTDEVLQTLAALPVSAWPYGRVVVVTENGLTSSEEQRIAIRRNKGILAGTLEGAQVAINWVPSA
jgi:hypothetical protein